MSILSNLDYRLQCLPTLAPEYVFRHQTNGNSISQCRVIQHKGCGENTVFYGVTCKQDQCYACRKRHLHDLFTTVHGNVVYGLKNHFIIIFDSNFSPLMQQYLAHSDIIGTIRSVEIFERRAIMLEIQSDIRMFSTYMVCHEISSKVFTKAQSLFNLIDVAVCDTEKCSSILQNKKRKMEVHIARLQRYEHRYEKSAIKPTQFISFMKTSLSKIDGRLNLARFSHLSWNESFNRNYLMQLFSLDRVTQGGETKCTW